MSMFLYPSGPRAVHVLGVIRSPRDGKRTQGASDPIAQRRLMINELHAKHRVLEAKCNRLRKAGKDAEAELKWDEMCLVGREIRDLGDEIIKLRNKKKVERQNQLQEQQMRRRRRKAA